MMNRFAECLTHVLKYEGLDSNNPLDRGGATSRGITQATYDKWRDRHGLPRSPVSRISGQELNAIYREDYWKPVCAEQLPAPLDLCVFDAAVQHGTYRAAKWLQRVSLSIPDGIVGQKTLEAVHAVIDAHGVERVIDEYMDIRRHFYAEIIANDEKQKVFERGWAHRCAELCATMKAMA
jgi:lysozyme family protein